MSEVITFTAVVQKVQTLVDGGLRFTFDVPESEVIAAAELMETKRLGLVLKVIVESGDEPEPQPDDTKIHI